MTLDQPGTKRVGLIGWPVAHSISPSMHNAAFLALKLNYSYETIPVRSGDETLLKKTISNLSARGFVGANVTVPHKQTIMRHLHNLTDTARTIGAVNTISISSDGKLFGDNTDADGFLDALSRSKIELNGMVALILGSGGSARAVAYALGRGKAARVTILGRSFEKGKQLANKMAPCAPDTAYVSALLDDSLQAKFEQAGLVINCTPVGMHGFSTTEFSSTNSNLVFNRRQTVYDLVYNPYRTPLLKRAAEYGATAIGGLGMLVHQGARAFEIWTGNKCPVEVMYNAAQNQLARYSKPAANEVK